MNSIVYVYSGFGRIVRGLLYVVAFGFEACCFRWDFFCSYLEIILFDFYCSVCVGTFVWILSRDVMCGWV